jgi:2-polyprenyl-3-methyl-5-hydroxy-6-metoxy-1,4-benzoquinol methylase
MDIRNPCVVVPIYAEDPKHYTLETLDIGCGAGPRFTTVERAGISVDLQKPEKPPQNFVRASAEALPFREGVFKCVTMFDVIEHVENPTRCVRESHRVLKEKGEFIMGTPNCMYLLSSFMIIRRGMYVLTTPNNTYEVDADHVATWGPPEMRNLLQRGGFQRFKVEPFTYRDKPHKLLPRLLLKLPWRGLTARQLLVKAWKT